MSQRPGAVLDAAHCAADDPPDAATAADDPAHDLPDEAGWLEVVASDDAGWLEALTGAPADPLGARCIRVRNWATWRAYADEVATGSSMTQRDVTGGAGPRSAWRLAVIVVAAGLAVLAAGCTSKATKSALPTSGAGVPGTVSAPPPGSAAVEATDAPASPPPDTEATTPRRSTPTTDPATTRPTTTDPPTTTTEPLITQGATVMVANASNVDGAASRLTDKLRAAGFTCQGAVTADGIERDLATTKVYVKPGSEDVARSVSRFLGDVPVAYMPTPISIKGGPINLGSATIVVMLGADKADK